MTKKQWMIILLPLLGVSLLFGLTDIFQLNSTVKQIFTTSFFILLGTLIYISLMNMQVKKCDRASRDLYLKDKDAE